jgi:PAS domain S-box-containing protein
VPQGKTQQIQHILIIEDDQGKRTITLEAATYSIGRDLSNSIVLDSNMVSRQHAILLRVTTPETASYLFRLIDGNLQGQRSKNGLSVNGRSCFSHDLQHGDTIFFGGDVRARYYATDNLSDMEFLSSCQVEEVSGFLSNLNNPFPTQSDRDLRNSQEAAMVRLASFAELISNPILEIDLGGTITYLNPAAIAQFPNIREANLQHPILAGMISTVKNSKEKFFIREVEVANQVFEQSVHYLAESDLIRSYVVDVTVRKRTEAALRESERRFRAIFDQTFQFSGLLKPDGTLLEANQTALDFGGLQHSDVIDCPFWEARWWTISSLTQKRLQEAIATSAAGKFVRYEVEVLGAGDTVTTIDFSLKPVKDEAGQVVMLIFEGRDISDRKLAEQALQKAHDELEIRVEKRTAQLRKANEQLLAEVMERQRAEEALEKSFATNRALLNAIPDWMFRIDKEGIFVNFKAAKDNHPPIPTKEFLGKNLYEVLPQQVAQPFINCVERALSTNEIQIFEYQLLLDRNLFDYEARIAVSAENEVMAIVRDITKRKRAEADIRKALEQEKELSELKTRFVTMTSHEFRTPLAAILSSAELLEHYSHKWSEEKKLNHLLRIQTSVKHMTELLNDVLLIGKAEAGKLEFKPTPLELTRFCQELVEEIQLAATNHTITFRAQNQCTNTCMDEKLLRHILSNLLSNAIKYSPQGSHVYFDLTCQPGEAIFQIQDRGIGIPLAEQATIFNSFIRASNVGTISGTGLGLAIVKKSVDLYGGNITVKSEVDVGTTFTVSLPLQN